MRIALLAPVMLPVPPRGYGGTELVVSMLAEGLVARGHEVTLFATGDSRTAAKLDATYPRALVDEGVATKEAYAAHERAHVARVFERAREFDLIHDHTKTLGVESAATSETPVVTTIHNDFTPERRACYERHRDHAYVAISHAQAARCNLNYLGVVHNGLDLSEPVFREKKQDYMLFLGRLAEVKGAHTAIRIALETGVSLVLAGKVDPVDRPYYEQEIVPHLDGTRVRYIGEVAGRAKWELLANARCLIFPVQWPEPFGLVSIEAMACGTPVVAAPVGALPEVVAEGVSGLLVPEGGDWAAAVREVGSISPGECRRWVEDRFGADRMVEAYLTVYRRLLSLCKAPAWRCESPGTMVGSSHTLRASAIRSIVNEEER